MSEQLSDTVTYAIDGEVAVITVDDGKANAMGHEAIDAVSAGFTRATTEAGAVVLAGRDGKFSAGFDLAVMQGDDIDAMRELFGAGGRLAHQIYLHPRPTVIACTGHALALGGVLLLCADIRVGARGPFKIGTTEVTIGLPLPRFACELADRRLSRRHLQLATQHGRFYDPDTAVDVGYLDEVTEPGEVLGRATTLAAEAASGLRRGAFAMTRGFVRDASAARVESLLALDVLDFGLIAD